MEQVCSNLRCSAVIVIPEGQEVALFDRKSVCEKCYGKPICTKCDPSPADASSDYAHKTNCANSEEDIIHTYLPKPKPGYAIRHVQVPDGEGGMRDEYVSRRVESEKSSTDFKLMKGIKKLFHFTQRAS
ncbi:uncharacterized protein BJ212DRAFT_1302686 [Suillus subaureus]|uniref:Uncharacterized protein n=1 Tax=Suillus subaureus TaxID=48587 RepID=A0A9P7J951_9AGAM|nr:uncharacterized protein BJ212DRAFT_1302686 [Suillus subaureus]KAG1809118.1 hypothetical protein BJ212DRAFT_1302686 [Suillus subaureus]